MSAIAAWFHSHAIDLNLAKEIGMRTDSNTLYAPYERADGSTFWRSRHFPDGDWQQPTGEPLALWWPLGRVNGGSVLLCEGEGDTLAAASILDKTDHPTLNGVCPIGLPGVAAVNRAADELGAARVRNAYICLDADEGGCKATGKLQELLPQVGVTPFPINIAEKDLADELASYEFEQMRESWLAHLVSTAEPQPIDTPPRPPSTPLSGPEGDLKDIPAPVWVSRLAGVEEPSVGSLIHCPLHDERTPSCRINDTWFFCYGCQRGGSIYDFAMHLWKCDFREAKERLLEEMRADAGSTPPKQQPSLIS